MSTNRVARPSSTKVVPMTTSTTNGSDVLEQYVYGAMPFIGAEYAFYERHLARALQFEAGISGDLGANQQK